MTNTKPTNKIWKKFQATQPRTGYYSTSPRVIRAPAKNTPLFTK